MWIQGTESISRTAENVDAPAGVNATHRIERGAVNRFGVRAGRVLANAPG